MASKPHRASLENLLKKPARTREVTIKTMDDAGKELELTLLFKSIGSKAYDDLLGDHPATKDQAKKGNLWNTDTFPPALISACSVDPQISVDDAKTIFQSDEWSRGELVDIFTALIKLNNEGFDIPFTSKDSD